MYNISIYIYSIYCYSLLNDWRYLHQQYVLEKVLSRYIPNAQDFIILTSIVHLFSKDLSIWASTIHSSSFTRSLSILTSLFPHGDNLHIFFGLFLAICTTFWTTVFKKCYYLPKLWHHPSITLLVNFSAKINFVYAT